MLWERFMRLAHAGAPLAAADEDDAASLASPPMVPMVEDPPVASKADLAPSEKLERMLSLARDAARRSGDVAAPAPARATPPTPDATPDAPD